MVRPFRPRGRFYELSFFRELRKGLILDGFVETKIRSAAGFSNLSMKVPGPTALPYRVFFISLSFFFRELRKGLILHLPMEIRSAARCLASLLKRLNFVVVFLLSDVKKEKI